MKRKIVFSLEYRGWPLWRYAEDGFHVIDNCTPPEWADDQELDGTLRTLQKLTDASYIDENGQEDFTQDHMTEEEYQAFRELLKRAKQLVAKKNNGQYYIEYHS